MNSFRCTRTDDEKHPTRHYSTIQESNIAKAVGGKRTANSGATMFQKGDVLTDNWLLEAKTCMTDKKSFSIKKEWIEKNIHERLLMKRDYAAVVFNFGPSSENYYIIDEETFKEFLELQKGK